MKKIALFAALAIAIPAAAQEAKPAAEPAKPAPMAQEAAKAPNAEAPKPRAPRKPNPHRQEDARHCLEKDNATEIIKCAEAYL